MSAVQVRSPLPFSRVVAPRDLAERLRQAIRDGHWTAYALGKAAGVPYQRVDALLAGKDIRLSTASKIIHALGGEVILPPAKS